MKDVFVIEIHVKKNVLNELFSAPDGHCYVRKTASTEKLTPQQIQHITKTNMQKLKQNNDTTI